MKPDNFRCTKAFEDGTQARCAYPLHAGAYKLRESYRHFIGWRNEITRINAFKHQKASRHSLRHCTSDDCSKWLKDLPEAIAFELAHNVLPGINALVADGVPPALCASALSQAIPAVNQLVEECDWARCIVSRRIANEYEHMKVGGSYLYPLVSEAIRILEAAFQQAALPHPRGTANNLIF